MWRGRRKEDGTFTHVQLLIRYIKRKRAKEGRLHSGWVLHNKRKNDLLPLAVISKTPSCDISRLILWDTTNTPPLWRSEAPWTRAWLVICCWNDLWSLWHHQFCKSPVIQSDVVLLCPLSGRHPPADNHFLLTANKQLFVQQKADQSVVMISWSLIKSFTTWTFSLLRHSGESSSASDRSAG